MVRDGERVVIKVGRRIWGRRRGSGRGGDGDMTRD